MKKNFFQFLFPASGILFFLASCDISKKLAKSAHEQVLTLPAFTTAHVGISVFEPATSKYWYDHQGDNYFIPASNTKIPTCYVTMKYLGDSLVGARIMENNAELMILPSGDPSLWHPDFKNHPVADYLKKTNVPIFITDRSWQDDPLGSGWSWNDFNENYMVERSPMPVYGNLLRWTQEREDPSKPAVIYSIPEVNWTINFDTDTSKKTFYVQRDLGSNTYTLTEGMEKKKEQWVPFRTYGVDAAIELMNDSLGKKIRKREILPNALVKRILSQPTDSLLKPMMHRSDNFFAEQCLQMVSNELLGIMNDAKLIDTILKTDFKDLPQRPRWADGSGLSRYNLFSPRDLVAILSKMEREFGMERIKVIFPTGGEGTISSYYRADSGFIYAKTGTLSGVVALSGFLYTKKGKFLIFSTIVNNHQASATEIRRAIEKFLMGIRNNY